MHLAMASLKQTRILSQTEFDLLLAWLDEDRERAGARYEQIRRRLIVIFAGRGCSVPEELADDAIDRVARKAAEIAEIYTGDKALYFYGVANYVFQESLKRKPEPVSELKLADELEEERHACLEKCLANLPKDSKRLILSYYAEDKQAKIDLRKKLADDFGLTINALRIKALRVRNDLQQCVERCLAKFEK